MSHIHPLQSFLCFYLKIKFNSYLFSKGLYNSHIFVVIINFKNAYFIATFWSLGGDSSQGFFIAMLNEPNLTFPT